MSVISVILVGPVTIGLSVMLVIFLGPENIGLSVISVILVFMVYNVSKIFFIVFMLIMQLFSKLFKATLKQKKVKKELFNRTRQYNIIFFYKNIFFKYRTRQISKLQKQICKLLILIAMAA